MCVVSAHQSGRPDGHHGSAASGTLPPAARDLKRLRDELDHKQTIVTITGTSTESAALYAYLSELDKADLFLKVHPPSIETDKTDHGQTTRFDATLVVRPGYGQPGGPVALEDEAAEQTGTPVSTTLP